MYWEAAQRPLARRARQHTSVEKNGDGYRQEQKWPGHQRAPTHEQRLASKAGCQSHRPDQKKMSSGAESLRGIIAHRAHLQSAYGE
jgi:hypothetical protein